MKRILLAGVAALALGTAAQAQTLVDRLVAGFQERGFTSIEVRDQGDTIKVEAVKDGVRAEFLYDAETGELISREVGGDDGEDDGSDDGDDGSDDGDDDDGTDDGDHGSDDGEDGDRGHGNDADGFDDNPGRGHGDDGQPGDGGGGGHGNGHGNGGD